MVASNLIQEMKKHSMLMKLAANHRDNQFINSDRFFCIQDCHLLPRKRNILISQAM